jgi:hypothetical protein
VLLHGTSAALERGRTARRGGGWRTRCTAWPAGADVSGVTTGCNAGRSMPLRPAAPGVRAAAGRCVDRRAGVASRACCSDPAPLHPRVDPAHSPIACGGEAAQKKQAPKRREGRRRSRRTDTKGGEAKVEPVVEEFAWVLPRGLKAPEVPADNPMTAAKVALGHELFFDKRLSVDGSRSCYSCHQNELGNADGRARALGPGDKLLARNTPTIWNVAYSRGASLLGRPREGAGEADARRVEGRQHGRRRGEPGGQGRRRSAGCRVQGAVQARCSVRGRGGHAGAGGEGGLGVRAHAAVRRHAVGHEQPR